MVQLHAQTATTSTLSAGRRVYEHVRSQIKDGLLQAGMKLPSTRALASELGMSRTTVSAAFEQLAAEGYLVTSVGRAARIAIPPRATVSVGSTVRKKLRSLSTLSKFGNRLVEAGPAALPTMAPVELDFLYGAVASRDFPRKAWQREHQAQALHQDQNLYYQGPEGDIELRKALQGYLRRARGLTCNAEQILVVHGAQQGIDLCARLLLNDDDEFVFEEPGYLMARRSFESTGAKALPTRVDDHGLDTACLPTQAKARLAYVTPSHQFPLGGVMPISRRIELLQWARRQGAWIIEDDYDGEFRYGQRPIDALQSIDSDGRVIYIGTFSKALSPQLRLGYMLLPLELVAVFRQAKRLADRHVPVLEQRILASLIESGSYERHIRRTRREHERRRKALLDAIELHLHGKVEVAGTAAGLHIVLYVRRLKPEDEVPFASAAREQEVGVYPLSPLFVDGERHARPAGFVLGYASLQTTQIAQGVMRLARVLAEYLRAQAQGQRDRPVKPQLS